MRNACLLTLLIVVAPSLGAQSRVFLSFNAGLSLYNSENSLKTIGGQALDWSPGFSVGYERDSLLGVSMRVEYAYTRAVAVNAMSFAVSGATGPEPVASFGADLAFTTHNLDIAACIRPVDFLSLAIGPTVSLAYRTIELTTPSTPGIPSRYFRDRLASLCLGANCSVDVEIPVQSRPGFLFVYSGLKIRYIHSVWFDKRGRDLSDYTQSSLLGSFALGLGYSF